MVDIHKTKPNQKYWELALAYIDFILLYELHSYAHVFI